MSDPLPRISVASYELFLVLVNEALERIVQDQYEYEHIGVIVAGLTPRLFVSISGQFETALNILFRLRLPSSTISKMASQLYQIIDSATVALFKIRDKSSFTPTELKEYLYNVVAYVTDLDHSPSFFDDYCDIDYD